MASRPAHRVHHFNDRPPAGALETRAGEALTSWARRHRERINCWLLGAAIGASAAIILRVAWTFAVWAAQSAGIA